MVEKGNGSVAMGNLGLLLYILERGGIRHPGQSYDVILLAYSCHRNTYISCETPKYYFSL